MSSYHDELKALAESIGSDGCSGPTLQVHVDCCWEHDWSYVTCMTPRGVPTTKAEADRRFRDCLQAHSPLRFLSPLAWWRWLAVMQFGRGSFPAPGVARRLMPFPDSGPALREARAAREAIIAVTY